MSADGPILLRLDVGRPDHLAPLLGVVGDELAEVGGRAREALCRPGRQAAPSSWDRRGAALISLLSLSTISAGVFLGAPTPNQALAS